jgi:hypothetical protein
MTTRATDSEYSFVAFSFLFFFREAFSLSAGTSFLHAGR